MIVLSAMGDTTDDLMEEAKSINEKASKREMDMLLAIGEQKSVALMAMALQSLGVPAISLNAFQVMMHTTSRYGNARFKNIDIERIQHELDSHKIVVVTGFQGVNKYNDVTTLGRGGSDTTAVALAAILNADACEIYTDVEGVYTADPRIEPKARKLKEITYDEMLDLATLGAKVLHNRSVEMAKKYDVPLIVRSSLKSVEGTTVKEEVKVEKMLISGVTADKNTARISVLGVKDKPGVEFRIFNLLAKNNINIDTILQSVSEDGRKDISFTIAQDAMRETLEVLNEAKDSINVRKIEYEENVAKVSIVGAGMISNPGVAAKMFEALYDEGISIKMISTSEIRVTVLVEEKDADKAVRAIHAAFALGE